MSESGNARERSATCPVCDAPVIKVGMACEACARESAQAASKTASRGRRAARGVRPLSDAEIARGLGQEDQRAAYAANGWKSGLRDSVHAKPTAHLGAGRITGTTAIPTRRLINANADKGTRDGRSHVVPRTHRAPSDVRHAIGKLAHKIRTGTGPMVADCAALAAMLGTVAGSGIVTDSDLRRQVRMAFDAITLASTRA